MNTLMNKRVYLVCLVAELIFLVIRWEPMSQASGSPWVEAILSALFVPVFWALGITLIVNWVRKSPPAD